MGFTPDGGPILQFKQSSPPPIPPGHAVMLGSNPQGHVLIAVQADKIKFIKASIGEQDPPSRNSSRRNQPGMFVSRPHVPPAVTPDTTTVAQQPPTSSPLPTKPKPLQRPATPESHEVKPAVYPLAARQVDSPSRVSYADLTLPEDGNPASLSLPTLGSSLQGQHSQPGSRRNPSAHRLTD